VICLIAYRVQIYNAYFDCANYFKDIFNLFSKVLKIKEKKTAANGSYTQPSRWRNTRMRIAAARYR
jgi:hypothetical protein